MSWVQGGNTTAVLYYRLVGAGSWTVGGSRDLDMANPKASFTVTDLPEGEYEFYVDGGYLLANFAQALMPSAYDTITGKTTTRYQRSYNIPLTGSGPWDIRLRRLTADSAQANLRDETYWESVTEIIGHRLTYPNSAIVALQADASAFRSIPRRGYDLKGLLLQVPSNYNPISRVYTGIWDGTFQTLWSDNPAWVFYDLVTNDRYGLGALIDSAVVDKWALYTIAQYCDTLVPDGFGNAEPRFTCNLYLQTAEEAYKVITSLASIFRSMVFWSGGGISAVQDAPADVAALFTNANVIDGAFAYQGSARTARHTVALVSWNDPADRYRSKIEYVEDVEGIARYGVRQTEVLAIGCTRRGQAHRLGRWLLYTERLETEVVSFRAGMDSLTCLPGDLIEIADPARAGARMGGRLAACTTTSATLDDDVTLASGETYTLSLVSPDGTVVSRPVTTGAGTVSVLGWSTALSAVPAANSLWVLSASNLAPTTWRVVAVSEVEKNIVEVTALEYNASKYAAIEQDLQLETPNTSLVFGGPTGPVEGLLLEESLVAVSTSRVEVRLTASWMPSSAAVQGYDVRFRPANGNWRLLQRTTATTVSIDGAEPGAWECSVTAVAPSGQASIAVTAQLEVFGKTIVPQDITGFTVRATNGLAHFAWDLAADIDVRIGGAVVVRHSPEVSGVTWNDAIVVEAFDGNATTGVGALMTGTYFAKAQDSSGFWSNTAASFVATEGMVTGFVTVDSIVEHPSFAGAKSNVASVDGELKLDSLATIDSMTDPLDTWGKFDSLYSVQTAGSYDFADVLDLTTVAVRRLQATIKSRAFDIEDTVDARLDAIDSWPSMDGSAINDTDLTLYAAPTNDDPTGSPTWGAWTPFFVADFHCRALKFRLDFASGSPTHNIAVSELSVSAQIPA